MESQQDQPVVAPPKSRRLVWLGMAASVIAFAAGCMYPLDPAGPFIARSLVWLSYVGFTISITSLHRAPVLCSVSGLLGLYGCIGASDIYSDIYLAIWSAFQEALRI